MIGDLKQKFEKLQREIRGLDKYREINGEEVAKEVEEGIRMIEKEVNYERDMERMKREVRGKCWAFRIFEF